MTFTDYERASDSVETSAAMKTLKRQRVEETHVKILEDIYTESTAFKLQRSLQFIVNTTASIAISFTQAFKKTHLYTIHLTSVHLTVRASNDLLI